MRCPMNKQIPISNVQPGEEFIRCRLSSGTTLILGGGLYMGEDRKIYKKSDNTLLEEQDVIYIERPYTFEEEAQWYKDQYDISCGNAAINLVGLYNDMYYCEGEHEMYNAWVTYDWYEMSDNLEQQSFYLYGIAPAPYPCSAFGKDSIAVVVEDFLTGDRFWCHTSKEWINQMREQMQDTFDKYIDGRKKY